MEGPSQQILCKAGCGFFGNPNTNELCSVCYKKSDPTKQQQPLLKPTSPNQVFRPVLKVTAEETKTPTSKVVESESPNFMELSVVDGKKKKNRCDVCRKKLGLIPIGCRCGGMFCGVHRYSDKHDCQFDYRELGRQELTKGNPTVIAEKLKKL